MKGLDTKGEADVDPSKVLSKAKIGQESGEKTDQSQTRMAGDTEGTNRGADKSDKKTDKSKTETTHNDRGGKRKTAANASAKTDEGDTSVDKGTHGADAGNSGENKGTGAGTQENGPTLTLKSRDEAKGGDETQGGKGAGNSGRGRQGGTRTESQGAATPHAGDDDALRRRGKVRADRGGDAREGNDRAGDRVPHNVSSEQLGRATTDPRDQGAHHRVSGGTDAMRHQDCPHGRDPRDGEACGVYGVLRVAACGRGERRFWRDPRSGPAQHWCWQRERIPTH